MCVFMYMCVVTSVCTFKCDFSYACYMPHTCIHTCIHMYICTRTSLHMYICTCAYVCMYIHIDTYIPLFRPVHPALHSQAVEVVLCRGELEFEGQVSHAVLPSDEAYFPVSQSTQPNASLLPTLIENLPAGQSIHAGLPTVLLYVPAGQGAHDPPSGPEEPALQVQAVTTKLPTGELEFDGQVSHAAAPG